MSFESRFGIENTPDAATLVRSAHSFEELHDAIRLIGTIDGSKQAYTVEFNLGAIAALREDPDSVPIAITNTYGLRDKVQELLDEERSGRN